MTKTVAIIQARMTSTRLPGKVLADLCGRPMLAHMLARVARARRLDAIWVATTTNAADDPVAQLCQSLSVPVFRGSESDVLGRYALAAAQTQADVVMRLTADCPMMDPVLIDEAVHAFTAVSYDYFSNAIRRTYPDGLDLEIFSRATLDEADQKSRLPFQREHVTPYMRTGAYKDVPTGNFRVGQMLAPADFGHLRWTVDTAEDLAHVRRLVRDLPAEYTWMDAIALLTRRPELLIERVGTEANIRLRPAMKADADLLFDWVNRPDKRATALNTKEPIARETHDAWFAARLSSPDAAIWIAVDDKGAAVGQVRLERRDAALEVDIYVEQGSRAHGVATAMLESSARRGRTALARPAVARPHQAGQLGFAPAVCQSRLRQHSDGARSYDPASRSRSPGGGSLMARSFDKTAALYRRALETIPLASQTFSKSVMSTVEGAAPLFLERGEGARVWDVDGNDYIDYVLGLLPVVLGYRDPDVDAAIRAQLDKGISFSLATALEAELAERLVELIPCAEMVRFGKNGSDATTAAIRLARAHTGRDKIAICGYHGWHDWYIGTTARHLGVPQAVRDLVRHVPVQRPDVLEANLKREPDEFAAVILEPVGLEPPKPGFLQALRALCDRYGVVLVFRRDHHRFPHSSRRRSGRLRRHAGSRRRSASRWATACRSLRSSAGATS